jgi:hypothetical protein
MAGIIVEIRGRDRPLKIALRLPNFDSEGNF